MSNEIGDVYLLIFGRKVFLGSLLYCSFNYDIHAVKKLKGDLVKIIKGFISIIINTNK